MTSLPSHAGKIYRFVDQNGVSTLSKILPPDLAQKGYDVLNDKTLSLIKHVDSLQQQQSADKKQQRIINDSLTDKKRKLTLWRKSKTLLDRYPSEQVLISSRDAELLHYQNQIDDTQEKIQSERKTLSSLQLQAANEELNSGDLSPVLKKKLSTTEKNIHNFNQYLIQLTQDKNQVSKKYNLDLTHLQRLLKQGL